MRSVRMSAWAADGSRPKAADLDRIPLAQLRLDHRVMVEYNSMVFHLARGDRAAIESCRRDREIERARSALSRRYRCVTP